MDYSVHLFVVSLVVLFLYFSAVDLKADYLSDNRDLSMFDRFDSYDR